LYWEEEIPQSPPLLVEVKEMEVIALDMEVEMNRGISIEITRRPRKKIVKMDR
jgi:hypothetical protein